MVTYGSYPWTVDDHVRLAAAVPCRWWASLDYCVEQEVAGDRDEVLDRMSRTIRANIECRLRAEDAGIDATFMPVIQGRHPGDYERCAEALAPPTERTGPVGVGRMFRPPVPGADGPIRVVDRPDQLSLRRTPPASFGTQGPPP